jgi:hypothetical protein
MSKREKTIIFIAILAVLYGAYILLLPSPSKKSETGTVNHSVSQGITTVSESKLVREMSDVLKNDESARTEAYIADRAEEEWTNDPFSTSDIFNSEKTEGSAKNTDKDNLIYSGFLEVGGRKTAIINGMDYRAGDDLEAGGYKVGRITPSSVIIMHKTSGEKITIPFLSEE